MSTKLGEFRDLTLTQFNGGPRGLCIQLDGSNGHGPTHIELDATEAAWLESRLRKWRLGHRAKDDE